MGRLWSDFKMFAFKGNVVDLAAAVVIGGAFGRIVSSFVSDLLMPPIGLLMGGMDLKRQALELRPELAGEPAVTLGYGAFLSALLDFLIVAACVFFLVRGLRGLRAPAVQAGPREQECPECLMAIPVNARLCGHCGSPVGLH